jgi:hypothetical protein
MPYQNIEDRRAAWIRWYERNKKQEMRRAKDNKVVTRERNQDYVFEYLSENPCVDCGETDILVLEFDHIRGKKKRDVSYLVRNGASIQTLKAEIAKCEVRCCNCHRRVTLTRSGCYRLVLAEA